MDALSLGKRLLTTDADQTAANVARLNDSQREMYRVGAAQALRDRIEGTQDAADATRRIFGNTQVRSRIAAGFGGENTQAFRNFRDTMEREAVFADTNRQLLQGSPTARRLAGMAEAQPVPPGLLLETAAHALGGNIPGAALRAGGALLPAAVNRLTQPTEAYSRELGARLFAPGGGNALMMPGSTGLAGGQASLVGPGSSLRNQLLGPWAQQAGQLLLNSPAQQRRP
jgi:hypothetical protein